MNGARFAVVILAAGFSSRMKQLKPLLPLGDATLTDFVVSTFQSLGIEVFIVVGNRKEEVISGIKSRGINFVNNPDFEKGMFSSIQAGIKQLGKEYQAFFILPVDIPLVGATTIKKMIDAGIAHRQNIIYPTFQGKRGHPPLIASGLIPEILAWKQDGGLKAYLKTKQQLAMNLPVNDSFILFDIDTPEDYKKLQQLYDDNQRASGHSGQSRVPAT
jgi:molybdenum cofactor cytidylyltransferase